MRILILNWREINDPLAGGAEKYLYEIGKRIAKMGHSVVFFGREYYPQIPKKDKINEIKIVRGGNKFTVYLWALWYLAKNRKKFDVVIDSENGIPFFSPLVFNNVICVMHHVHLDVFDKELSFPLNLVGKFLEGRLMPYIYKNKLFVSVSPSTKKEIIERLKIKPEQIKIVYNGVDYEKLSTQSIISKFKDPTVIYFGRVKRYKRIDHVIRALALTKRKIKNVKLIIAGKMDNNICNELKKLADELNVYVEWYSNVENSLKNELLSKSWIYVITSLKEGWGISVIEANACGTPVVSYDVPGLRDSVRNSYNGILVRNGNIKALSKVIICLLENPKVRKKLSHNARKWAKRFSWERSMQYIIQIISER
ncbi:glycosyltransferase family 4 protein [Thermococcus barophilus]|uniref:Glycosyltransferase n=1 Tax=Thermococcus barophilus (strain DSM 11836 / MP) TaxID=391623 RepID=F0LLT6_THEBM|nr:glycosyltransferase family 4 protein [Thermococcus barophilus]ADT83863.1 glycosyltransferase [Thermococcus barophilus MP]